MYLILTFTPPSNMTDVGEDHISSGTVKTPDLPHLLYELTFSYSGDGDSNCQLATGREQDIGETV